VTYKTGSVSDDWTYRHIIHTTRDYRQYSGIADLHTLQFTVTHTHTKFLSLH
jgi:endonuclease I